MMVNRKISCKRACNKQACNSLVTGGVQGIGLAIAKTLVARGDNVFVFDYISPDDERVQALKNQGISYLQVDVSSVDSIKNGFEQLFAGPGRRSLGEGWLDILVNNAGITRDSLALRLSEQDWDAVLQVNLKGSFFCAQQALKRMIKQEKSYIINMASVVGLHGNPGQINYAASKAGVIAMTKTLAKEYAARNVLVNAVAPGFIQTKMTEKISESFQTQILEQIPLKRFGQSQDVANLVSFLTSGNADYLTGQVICLDGGMTI
ncbi:3-oxoacyl-ACP reductase FabG [Candidatus Babeliales bacterium]|nr:3-oxoacyl-ACP reductase FabG [Candidatus Babeliales bacterium]